MIKRLSLKHFAYTLIGLGVIVALWYLILGHYFSGSIFRPDVGKAKDIQPFMTGLIAPLFTLASTLLVITTLRYQTRQNFISNFFNLLNQHHKLLDGISSAVDGITDDKSPSKKKDFFDDLAQRIAYDYTELHNDCNVTTEQYESKCATCELVANVNIDAKHLNGKAKIVRIYDYYFHIHHSDLGHYFRNLFHIVRFIDEQPFTLKTKIQHTSILRAQLSNYELVLLSYNCLHEYGEAFSPLVTKYNLNKSINDETRVASDYHKRIIDIEVIRECYPNLQPPKGNSYLM